MHRDGRVSAIRGSCLRREEERGWTVVRRSFFELIRLSAFLLICVIPLAAAEPLSKEHVMLLVLSGTTAAKKVEVIQQRGIDFPISSEVMKELRDLGAEATVLRT